MAVYLDIVCTDQDRFQVLGGSRSGGTRENRTFRQTNRREEQSLRVIGEILPFVLAKYSLQDRVADAEPRN